jgi:hypothetical protein
MLLRGIELNYVKWSGEDKVQTKHMHCRRQARCVSTSQTARGRQTHHAVM